MQITLKAARVNAGINQEAAAKALGISKSTIIKWESGKCAPRADKFQELCNVYGVGIDNIFLHSKSTLSRKNPEV